MADKNGQEKSEQPTSKRRKDARKEGNVFQSKDIITVVMIFGVFWMARMMMPYIYKNLRDYMVRTINGIGGEMEDLISPQLFSASVIPFLKCVMPLLLVSIILGIVSPGIQTRFNVSFHMLRPKFSKLNPINGLKKMFALKNAVELLKNMIKITLLLFLLYNILKDDLVPISRMMDMQLLNSAAYMMKIIFDLVLKVSIAFAVVAFFDFLYQRWEYERDLKMTKQEVKEEYKQTEGNPEIKGRIRKIQRQMALSRMMQKVPEADVIIRNPTHIAIAIQYDPDKHGAPVVVAKGQDELAMRIVRVGEEHGVFVTEDKPLARALYRSCQLDREIPSEFYGAVAEILVLLYRTGHREDMLR